MIRGFLNYLEYPGVSKDKSIVPAITSWGGPRCSPHMKKGSWRHDPETIAMSLAFSRMLTTSFNPFSSSMDANTSPPCWKNKVNAKRGADVSATVLQNYNMLC